MDELEYYSNQFLEEYMLLKTAYNLRFRLKLSQMRQYWRFMRL